MNKRILYIFLIAISFLLPPAIAYAIGDGSSSSSDMPSSSGFINLQEERGRSIMVSTGFEHIFERNIEDDGAALSGKIKGDWLLLGAGYRIKNLYEPYIRLGLMQMNVQWNQGAGGIEMDSDYGWAAGAGFKMLAQKIPVTSLSMLKVHFDGQVRYTNPDMKDVKVNGVNTSRNVSADNLNIFEARASATVGIEISLKKLAIEEDEEEEWLRDTIIMPYAGIGYINSLTTAKFNLNGTTYGFDETPQGNNFGAIAGLDLIVPQYVIFNLEGQIFGDDKSASGGFNIKF